MKVYVLLAEGFEEIEALSPTDYLRRAGVAVATLSCAESLCVRGAHGISVTADMMVDEAVPAEADGVIVPGGMPGAANIARCAAATKLISRLAADGKLVAAICAAPVVVLSGLGLLKGNRFTCYPSMEQELERWAGAEWRELTAGSRYTGSRVEEDGSLVTAAGPGAAEEFSFVLARRLAGDEAAERMASAALFRTSC